MRWEQHQRHFILESILGFPIVELELAVICLFRNSDFCQRLTFASTDCLSTLQVTSLCCRV